MAAYLIVSQYRTRSTLPGEDIDWLEAAYPGFLSSKLEAESAWINARLFKRYAVPFASPEPDSVLGWLTVILDAAAWKKRGGDPSGDIGADLLKSAEAARAEVKEAADSEVGLFDLPLRQSTEGASGVTHGGPQGYSEASPYTWTDVQSRGLCR